MKKIVKLLLCAAIGTVFPAAFLLFLVTMRHFLDGNIIGFPVILAILAVAWLLYRKLERYE